MEVLMKKFVPIGFILCMLLLLEAAHSYCIRIRLPIDGNDVTLQVPLYDVDANDTLEPGITPSNLKLKYIRVETDEDVVVGPETSLVSCGSLTADHNDKRYRKDVKNQGRNER